MSLVTKKQVSASETTNLSQVSENSIIILDPNEFYTIALLNTKQLFINFQMSLEKIDKCLELKVNKNQLSILNSNKSKQNNDWKLKVMLEINDYFTSRAAYKVVLIPEDIFKSQSSLETVKQNLADYNKLGSAYYFRQVDQTIHCYGCKNALNNKILSLNELFKTIKEASKSATNLPASKLIQKEALPQSRKNSQVLANSGSDFEIEPSSLTSLVLLNIKQVLNDFKNNVKSLDTEVINQGEAKSNNKLIIRCISSSVEPVEWNTRVKNFITDFEKNQILKRKIEIPAFIKNPKELDDLKIHLKRSFNGTTTIKYEYVNNSILVYGYTKAVNLFENNALAKFKNLENNIKDRIKTKLEIKITKQLKPLEFNVLSLFKGVYLKEFTSSLAKLFVSIEKLSNGFRLSCNLDKEKLKNEQIVDSWRSNINSFMSAYFSKFSIQKLNVSSQKFEKISIDESLVNVTLLNSSEAEISGIKTEVNRIVALVKGSEQNSQAPKKPVVGNGNAVSSVSNTSASSKSSTTSKSSQVSAKSASEETFLINDLKWFQTRILFEKNTFNIYQTRLRT